jgi:hypothetical protein
MRVELNDITLCALDSQCRPLAARALEISSAHCKFADSILFSDQPVDGSFRNVKVDPLASLAAYTSFLLKEMHKLIRSPFVLVTQWDGYVVDPGCWQNEFLQYDYIGATWPWRTDHVKVGNGGFSLRSKRLLEAISQPGFELRPDVNEDELICCIYRPVLEQKFQIRFAPPEVADRFSYERSTPQAPTFGFHGMFNFWREVSDTELIQMIPLMPPSILHHSCCAQLTVSYYYSRRWRPLRALYTAWRSRASVDDVRQILFPVIPAEFAAHCLQTCESLLRTV